MQADLNVIKEDAISIDDSFPKEAITNVYKENYDQFDIQKIRNLRIKNDELSQNNDERKRYALWIFLLTCSWGVCIFTILFFQGFGSEINFKLTDSVLITLITSTTINFFGFFLLVTRYLFATKSNPTGSTDVNKITQG